MKGGALTLRRMGAVRFSRTTTPATDLGGVVFVAINLGSRALTSSQTRSQEMLL